MASYDKGPMRKILISFLDVLGIGGEGRIAPPTHTSPASMGLYDVQQPGLHSQLVH
jgi:hypothetical protein